MAREWAERMAAQQSPRSAELVFPLTQLARLSGDRARDLDPAVRERVAVRLAELGAPEQAVQMVREFVELTDAEEQRVFGESLPSGLKLLGGPENAGS